ncbi:MAG: bile acid:sodium symporter family protein [Acidobacteriota bacterium]|nr:MAG: bile acid:sodium symporter family protein [Acidobacteriota bacterium]
MRGTYRKYLPGLGVLALILALIGWISGSVPGAGAFLILTFACFGVYLGGSKKYSAFAFTVWVAAFVAAAMFFPTAFLVWFGFELKSLIVPLIQIIMFGMGTQLTLGDFKRVFTMPRAVLIGIVLQFAIMPFVGKALAMTATSDPEIAAGMVLVGSCPGGVASNVMAYLAGGNVALSVTMTACSTLIAPLMTPLMTSLLAGTYVEVKFWAMMIAIIKMIIVPIVGGLVVNMILTRSGKAHPGLSKISTSIMKGLPFVSMFSICFIIAIITSLSRDALLMGGFVIAIMVAVVFHNAIGYLLGYWGARLFRLSETDARTVAIEVGLQNGGMASGLAIEVLKSELAAIPPAIFGPWMNMSGAMLASWWKGRPPTQK